MEEALTREISQANKRSADTEKDLRTKWLSVAHMEFLDLHCKLAEHLCTKEFTLRAQNTPQSLSGMGEVKSILGDSNVPAEIRDIFITSIDLEHLSSDEKKERAHELKKYSKKYFDSLFNIVRPYIDNDKQNELREKLDEDTLVEMRRKTVENAKKITKRMKGDVRLCEKIFTGLANYSEKELAEAAKGQGALVHALAAEQTIS